MLLVYSDLDATLLDHENYSFNPAIPALKLLEKKGIPLILASSKTYQEMIAIKKSMGNYYPFIYENGSGIFFRKKQKAFHPNATQFSLEINESIFGLWRQSLDREQSIFSIHNVSNKTVTFNPSLLNMIETNRWRDLISGKSLKNLYQEIKLKPYKSIWLSNK